MTPLTKLEFKKPETGFACAIGDASDCSAVGIAEVSCDSMVCVPVDASRHFTVFDVLLLHLTREVNIRADHDPD